MVIRYIALIICCAISFWILGRTLGLHEPRRMARRRLSVRSQISLGISCFLVGAIDLIVIELIMPHQFLNAKLILVEVIIVILAGFLGFVIAGRRKEINEILWE